MGRSAYWAYVYLERGPECLLGLCLFGTWAGVPVFVYSFMFCEGGWQ